MSRVHGLKDQPMEANRSQRILEMLFPFFLGPVGSNSLEMRYLSGRRKEESLDR